MSPTMLIRLVAEFFSEHRKRMFEFKVKLDCVVDGDGPVVPAAVGNVVLSTAIIVEAGVVVVVDDVTIVDVDVVVAVVLNSVIVLAVDDMVLLWLIWLMLLSSLLF